MERAGGSLAVRDVRPSSKCDSRLPAPWDAAPPKADNKAVVNPFTPLFSQNSGYNYGFNVSIPILNGFNTRRLIRQAELDIRYQQLFFENQRLIVNVGVSNAFKSYEYQKRH